MTLLFAAQVFAQFDAGASMDLGAGYGQIALSQSIMTGTREIGSGNAGATTPSKDKTLRLYWRDSISREFRDEMIVSLSRDFKLSKPAARKLLEEVNPVAGFQEVTYKNSLDMFNIADLLTAYCAVSSGHGTQSEAFLVRNQITESKDTPVDRPTAIGSHRRTRS